MVGEDVLVTKFRLQVAGSTLGGRIKAPRRWPLRKSQELKSGCRVETSLPNILASCCSAVGPGDGEVRAVVSMTVLPVNPQQGLS